MSKRTSSLVSGDGRLARLALCDAYRSRSSLDPHRDKTAIVFLISSFGRCRHTNLADPVQKITGKLDNARAKNSCTGAPVSAASENDSSFQRGSDLAMESSERPPIESCQNSSGI